IPGAREPAPAWAEMVEGAQLPVVNEQPATSSAAGRGSAAPKGLDARGLGGGDILDRQLDATAVVDVQYQHFDFLAFLEHVSDLLDALIAQHRDVHQAVLARQDVDEGTEVDDALDAADVDLADLGLGGDRQHALLGSLGRFLGLAEDLDRAVVLDVDGSLGLFADATDGGAALADDVAALVLVDLHRQHGRGIGRQLAARLGNDLVHLAEDVQTGFQSLAQGDLHDLLGDALDLDVHLQRGDAVGGTGDLEVHVAQVVFVTQDVGQHGELLAFQHQAHGDTGHRRLHRHAGVHQRQGGAAHGGHGGGTVGLGDLRHHADGVGEVVALRQHGGYATAGQAAVTDLATAGAAHAAALAHRERREVVVQHEGIALLAFQGVQQLGVTGGAEGGNDQGLGFAAGEQGRT